MTLNNNTLEKFEDYISTLEIDKIIYFYELPTIQPQFALTVLEQTSNLYTIKKVDNNTLLFDDKSGINLITGPEEVSIQKFCKRFEKRANTQRDFYFDSNPDKVIKEYSVIFHKYCDTLESFARMTRETVSDFLKTDCVEKSQMSSPEIWV